MFDWKWDAKRILRNISQPEFLQAVKDLEEAAGVVSFETKDVLQQVDLNFEWRKSRNLFSWAKWITPIIAGIISFLLSIQLKLKSFNFKNNEKYYLKNIKSFEIK